MPRQRWLAALVFVLVAGAALGSAALRARPAGADFPHPGIDFSIGVGSLCDSTNGPTTCDVSGTFTLEFRLNSIPDEFAYNLSDAALTHTSGLSVDDSSLGRAGPSAWPDCAASANSGVLLVSCEPFVDATYTGPMWRIEFTCTQGPSQQDLTLLSGLSGTFLGAIDTANGQAFHGEAASESLTIDCGVPTPDPRTPTATPILPRTLPLERVAAGGGHTCFISPTGGVSCFGWNGSGQLGIGTTVGPDECSNHNPCSIRPVDVVELDSVAVAVTAGGQHTCALTDSGGVKCWGANANGQLGDGTTTTRTTPVDVVGLTSGVAGISAKINRTCAVTTAGGVKCWGAAGAVRTPGATSPMDVKGLSRDISAVSVGVDHACALTSAGGIRCWGGNRYGQLGIGTTTDQPTPVDVIGATSGFVGVSAGGYRTCAVRGDGVVLCWGSEQVLQPAQILGLDPDVIAVSAGWDYACALTARGNVQCWGANGVGQLGDGAVCGTICRTPVHVVGLDERVLQISAGHYHTCAVTETGSLACWGAGGIGQLGNTDLGVRPSPVTVLNHPGGEPLSGVAAVAPGALHTCVLMADGGVKCWGVNWAGQLGDGTTIPHTTPKEVRGLEGPAASIVSAGYHTCVLLESGSVECWGDIGGSVPAEFTGLTDEVVSLATGLEHVCFLTSSGGVQCWGRNTYGQLGDGTRISHSDPVDATPVDVCAAGGACLPPLAGVTALATGGGPPAALADGHTCAIISGDVACWGHNVYGQAGIAGWVPCGTSGGITPCRRLPELIGPLLGDANCDGVLDSIDALIDLQVEARVLTYVPCADAADVDGNSRIDAADASLVLQRVAGLLT